MLRPPQPAVYLILLDVSHSAVETGYLEIVCQVRELFVVYCLTYILGAYKAPYSKILVYFNVGL